MGNKCVYLQIHKKEEGKKLEQDSQFSVWLKMPWLFVTKMPSSHLSRKLISLSRNLYASFAFILRK